MNRVTKYFEALQHVVAAEEVLMVGAWTGMTQRPGGAEGPPGDALDWRWEGTFEGVSSLAGLALLAVDRRLYWVKSHPPAATPSVAFSASAWASRTTSVSATGCFHGAYLPGVPIEITDEPPIEGSSGDSRVTTGTPHVVMQLRAVVFAVLLLPATAVQVGRNRLWRLHDGLASSLPTGLRQVMCKGRSGEIALR